MANIIKRAIRIFNGKEWDKYHPETSADQVVYTKPDGTASNVQTELAAQNSALKWSDWKTLGNNKLGIGLQYRYNAQEVELQYKGTLKELNISGGSAGYDFPALPKELNPLTNVDFPIYACAGNNTGKLTLRCFPTSTPNTFTITSHTTLTTTEEYICGRARYTRG